MITPRYQIGTNVFRAAFENKPFDVPCPNCWGDKYLTVILGDKSQVTVECTGCKIGYEPPRGTIVLYQSIPVVHKDIIVGIELRRFGNGEERYVYQLQNYYGVEETNIFLDRTAAEIRAQEFAQQAGEEALKQFFSKEKDRDSWARNATYHCNCLKHAQMEVNYHQAKLNAALSHKKDGEE
jgi:hypothetical protein